LSQATGNAYLAVVSPTDIPSDPSQGELVAIREIAHSFLNAERPEDVYRLALERVTPLAGAAFASVYLVEPGSDVLRLAASYNWPEKWRPWLGQMVVRIGLGPSGEAASERRTVEIPDVFADDELEDWQEVAGELGFAALVALPLATPQATLGAVTFYYTDAGPLTDTRRSLLKVVASQMAATAEKAALIAALRRSNEALSEANVELERRNAALVEARQARDDFLTTISHELRTPLTAVIGYVALLEEGVNGPLTTEQLRDLTQVRRASDRLLSLVDDLLDLATLKRGDSFLHRESLDPRKVLSDAIELMAPPKEGVELEVVVPDSEMEPVSADERRMKRVLVALLDNARKFTEAGSIRVVVKVVDSQLEYEVSDTGIGIPDALHECVFDEFRQADGTVTRRHGGAGLGLAIARRLARLLGGDVSLLSSSASGTTFRFTLPLAGSVPAEDAVAPMSSVVRPDAESTSSAQ